MWVLGTIAGTVSFLILSFPLNALFAALRPAMPEPGQPSPLLQLLISLSSAIMGAAFGLGQWLVLRTELRQAGAWVLATAVGYGVGSQIPRLLRCDGAPWLCGSMMLLSYGAAIGILQWLVLRGRVYQAGWWIPISLAGWLLAFALTGVAILSGLYVEPFDMAAALLAPTMVSGAGMVWLLRRTPHAA